MPSVGTRMGGTGGGSLMMSNNPVRCPIESIKQRAPLFSAVSNFPPNAFIRTQNEPFSVATMRVNNPNCLPVGINR
jgi:hypothetical protein